MEAIFSMVKILVCYFFFILKFYTIKTFDSKPTAGARGERRMLNIRMLNIRPLFRIAKIGKHRKHTVCKQCV